MSELFTSRRDYVVQCDKGSGDWYDFSIWGDRDHALNEIGELMEHRSDCQYRLVERITTEIREWKP